MKTLLHITTRANGAKPVESGKRATSKGFTMNAVQYLKTGIWKFKNNYTGLFFMDGTHMTWAYGKGRIFPENVTEGDTGTVTIIGHYSDAEVSCDVVIFNDSLYQP